MDIEKRKMRREMKMDKRGDMKKNMQTGEGKFTECSIHTNSVQ
jgi:hypothetical protein